MKRLKLFPMLILVGSLIFLPACDAEPEGDIVPPAAEETELEVEQDVEEVNPEMEVEQDLEEVNPEMEVEQEADEFGQDIEALNGYTFEQRQEFEQEVGALAQEYDARIADLEAQAAQLDEATRAELDQEIAELRQQRDQIQQQMDQIGAATAEEWDQFRQDLMGSIESFEQSFEETESRIG